MRLLRCLLLAVATSPLYANAQETAVWTQCYVFSNQYLRKNVILKSARCMPITIKTASFTVESYDVTVNQATDGNRRVIHLTSPDLSHGIRFKAWILFFKTNFSGSASARHVNNLEGTNFDPRQITVWGDPSLFDGFYAVLNSESPVTFSFDYEVGSSQPNEDQKDIRSYQLFTSKETPGDFEQKFRTVFQGLTSLSSTEKLS
ncbi:hypothetical protein [Fibrisoma limi]|nr:hypothetical protein [Fibrisoma limi]